LLLSSKPVEMRSFYSGADRQGRIMFAEAAEPAEQMGIAAQLGEVEHLREICLEIRKEVTGHAAIMKRRAGADCGRESLDTHVKNVTK
jgi:hypothetical protein